MIQLIAHKRAIYVVVIFFFMVMKAPTETTLAWETEKYDFFSIYRFKALHLKNEYVLSSDTWERNPASQFKNLISIVCFRSLLLVTQI